MIYFVEAKQNKTVNKDVLFDISRDSDLFIALCIFFVLHHDRMDRKNRCNNATYAVTNERYEKLLNKCRISSFRSPPGRMYVCTVHEYGKRLPMNSTGLSFCHRTKVKNIPTEVLSDQVVTSYIRINKVRFSR